MKKLFHFLLHRLTLTVLSMLVQLFFLVVVILYFNSYFVYFYFFSMLVSGLLVLSIINGRDNPAYKIAWLVPILILPIFGGLIYLVFGHSGLTRAEQRRMKQMNDRAQELFAAGDSALEQLEAQNRKAALQATYIQNYAYCPPSTNNATQYLPLGELAFADMLREMEGAERYIFLEYFIVQPGKMWDTVLDVLRRKAAQGLDVRVIYDDLGCIFTLPYDYQKQLEKMGIRCCVFNPFRPVLSSRFNNRSHRKLTSVDGRVAYTGGINMADEYINAFEKHGHWKDCAIRIEGDAAWQMTAAYLVMWDYLCGQTTQLDDFRPGAGQPAGAAGYVQPYWDSPLDDEPVGENVYLNLLCRAEEYVYITTPYLIVDNETASALCTAAKSGVDVRIITPHIPDKWYVHAVTRHSYALLIESGVRIFEYTPGFIHAKTFVADDAYGVVGTVNLDYRSLHLHFENGVWMYGTTSIRELRDDFLATQALSGEVTLEDCRAVSFWRRLGRSVLAMFAPLM